MNDDPSEVPNLCRMVERPLRLRAGRDTIGPSEMSDFRFRDAVPGDEPFVRDLVFDVLREHGLTPDPGATDADLADLAASYVRRGGAFRILESPAGEIVGCGGLYPLDGDEVEIRKMYFRPQARGRGLGRQLLEDLVGMARGRGFRRVVLETATPLERAIALYRSYGFVPHCRGHHTSRCDQGYMLDLGAQTCRAK